jgi:hypothetical protein
MKNYNKVFKAFLISSILIFGIGCQDILEVDNQSILLAENNFKTGNDVNASIIGLYGLLQPVAQQVVIYNEARADLVQPNSNARKDLLDIANGEIGTENAYLNLRDFYKVISSCNDILFKMEGVLSLDPSYTATIHHQYKAEVLGIRTWTYFQISKIFGKISYYNDAIINIDSKVQISELSAKEAINQLITDFAPVVNNFITIYPTSYSVDWRISRFNNWAARMLYAELLVYKGAFNQTELIDNYKIASKQLWSVLGSDSINTSLQMYKVGSTYQTTNWKNIFTSLTNSNNEVIWAIDFSKTNEQTHLLHEIFQTKPQLNTTNVSSTYLVGTDSRTSTSYTNSLVGKFSLNKTFFEADAPIILYRAADLHLLYAETINRVGDPDFAMKVVNTGYAKSEITPTGEKIYNAQSRGVRGRAGMALLVLGTSNKISQAEGYIRDERIRELAFEGKRWESLVRYAILDGKNTITVRGKSFSTDKWYAPSN